MLLPSLVFSLVAAPALWIYVRKHPSGNSRLAGVILTLLLVLPLLHFAPKISVAVTNTAATSPPSFLVPALWLAGALVFAMRGLSDFLAISRWRNSATSVPDLPLFKETLAQLKVTQKVALRTHPQLRSPVVAGLLHPAIYLPESSASWSKETLRMALLHELGHIQRRDLWMAQLAHLACILHWFNPAVWWLRRTFLTQCEYACDTHLLDHGADPTTYARALCDVAQSASTPPFSLAMAGHVPLRSRILFLSANTRRGSVMLSSLVFATATSAIVMSLVRLTPMRPDFQPFPFESNPTESQLRFEANPFPAD